MLVLMRESDGRPEVLARERVDLVDAPLPRRPYHAIVEAGARPTIINAVARQARASMKRAFQRNDGLSAVGRTASQRIPLRSVGEILTSHARLHAAEGDLYERAVIEAANELLIPVFVLTPTQLHVPESISSLGRVTGGRWEKDHKWAATARLSALESG